MHPVTKAMIDVVGPEDIIRNIFGDLLSTKVMSTENPGYSTVEKLTKEAGKVFKRKIDTWTVFINAASKPSVFMTLFDRSGQKKYIEWKKGLAEIIPY